MATLRIMSSKGHDTMTWNPELVETIEEPRTKFKEFSNRGWLSFAVAPETKQPTQIFEFDPKADSIVMVAPVSGG